MTCLSNSPGSAVEPERPQSVRLDGSAPMPSEVGSLFHRLNNQLGVILANSELLEHKLADDGQRLRAGLIVSGTLDAIDTVQHLRQVLWAGADANRR